MPQETARIYVGIDPSLRSSGFASLQKNKVLSTNILNAPKKQGAARLATIRDLFLLHLPKGVAHACIEGPSYGSVNRADDLGQVRGMFLLALFDAKIPVTIIPPTVLKKFAVKGDASKTQMVLAAEKEFNTHVTSDDIADALWLAQIAQALYEDTRLTRRQLEVVRGIREPRNKHTFYASKKTLNI
jgi:Holliday junction resolvasome RuvABC endonuclease subunit